MHVHLKDFVDLYHSLEAPALLGTRKDTIHLNTLNLPIVHASKEDSSRPLPRGSRSAVITLYKARKELRSSTASILTTRNALGPRDPPLKSLRNTDLVANGCHMHSSLPTGPTMHSHRMPSLSCDSCKLSKRHKGTTRRCLTLEARTWTRQRR